MPWPILLAALFVTTPGQTRSAGYDPARDPARDLEVVVKQAQQEGKGSSWSSAASGAAGVTPWRPISRTTRTFEPSGRSTL